MPEVMIDIETLDTAQSAVVLSIGLMSFDENGLEVAQLTVYPRVDEQLKAGRTVSLATMKFWAEQSGGAVSETFLPEAARTNLAQSTEELHEFLLDAVNIPARLVVDPARVLENAKGLQVWANGDIFDLGIITSLLGRAPWPYNAPRDLRTVMREAGRLGWLMPEPRPDHAQHSAISDCRYQVDCLMSARRFAEGKIGFKFDGGH